MSQSTPDRPLPRFLVPIREIIRAIRRMALKVRLRSKLKLGRNVSFGRAADLRPPAYAHFSDNVSVGKNLTVETNLKVGSDSLISSNVSFVGNDHLFDDSADTVYFAGRSTASTINLQGDNLIGFGVIVVGNVTIGKGCIVGAGSIVTRDLPSYTVCVGIPAQPIRKRRVSYGDTDS